MSSFGNRVLDELSGSGSSLLDAASLDQLRARQVLDADGTLGAVWFPASAIVSLGMATDDGRTVGLTIIGINGFVGDGALDALPLLAPATTAMVQVAGSAWCVPAEVFHGLEQLEPQTHLVLRRARASVHAEVARQVLCALTHTVEQRVCRWMLLASDRSGSGHLGFTQADLAEQLGVRRASVNAAARHLSDDGLVAYQRGQLEVRDAAALQHRSCSCYGYATALSEPAPAPHGTRR